MKKGFSQFIIIVIILSVLILAGVTYNKLRNDKPAIDNQTYQTINTPNASPLPSDNLKLYTNNNLKISFRHSDVLEQSGETKNSASFGQKAINGYITYLTISKDRTGFTNYKAIDLCSQATTTKTCIETTGWEQKEPVSHIKLDGNDAISFYLGGGADFSQHIVQTTVEPAIELKMNVAGGGLENSFEQVLNSFKFLK